MNQLVSAMHDATHRVPGVPEHSDTQPTHVNARQNSHAPRVHTHTRRHHNSPRVLVAWQNWIGRLVSRNDGRQ